ncbi:hypothetical protein EQ821_27050 [Escherichia coli]|nr:hypothetical protein EQ821_27050 [Escherichia coli]
MTSIASYRAGLGYCICKKQTTDLFISGGVLVFYGEINFSFEKWETCYYLKLIDKQNIRNKNCS